MLASGHVLERAGARQVTCLVALGQPAAARAQLPLVASRQVLGRHFSMLPRVVRRDSVLCLGRMTLQWRGLAVGPNEEVRRHAAVSMACRAGSC